MEQKTGYSLVDTAGNEVWGIGNVLGQEFGLPEVIALPNGDQVHCAQPGDMLGEWQLVERWMSDDRPSRWHAQTGSTVSFDGTKVIETLVYEGTPTIVPQKVTPRQARLALLGAGLLATCEGMIEADGGATKITWEYATEFSRSEPLIMTLGTALGLTSGQIDDLFRAASSL